MYFSLLIILAQSKSCPDYKCKSDSQSFTKETCIYYKKTDSTEKYYAHKCSSDGPNTYCNVTVGANSTCIAPEYPPRLPGEKCSNEYPCQSASECHNGICIPVTIGGVCNDNYNCNVTQYCGADGKCTNQTNKTCVNDEMCENNYACNNTEGKEGKCVEYFSIQDYDYVAKCEKNESLLCNTGVCVFYKGHNRCFGPAINRKAPPYVCDSTCKSQTDDKLDIHLEAECVCGYNSDQKRVCMLFNQDDKANKFFRMYKEWYQGEEINKCHTMGRFSFECIKEHSSDYEEFMYRYYKFKQYPYQYFADDCVKKVFLPEYYHFDDVYDSALILFSGLSLIFLV